MAGQRTPLHRRTRRGRGEAPLGDLSPGEVIDGVADGERSGADTPVGEVGDGAPNFYFPQSNNADVLLHIETPETRATPPSPARKSL